tara:strand:- start:2650 stop:2823 length:174 start_codon:yes stop_codon:yes gene_type:complete
MSEVNDLTAVPLAELTDQQIKSRLHLVRDEQVRLSAEQVELKRMENALMKEMWKRND